MKEKEDRVFKALADPTRRRMLDLLRENPRTTGQLATSFDDISRCAVMKHLRVLEEAELISVKRKGRFRWNYLNPVPIQQIYNRWICNYTAGLAQNLPRLKRHLEDKKT